MMEKKPNSGKNTKHQHQQKGNNNYNERSRFMRMKRFLKRDTRAEDRDEATR